MQKIIRSMVFVGVLGMFVLLSGCEKQVSKGSGVSVVPAGSGDLRLPKPGVATGYSDGRKEGAGHLTAKKMEIDFGTVDPRQIVHGKFILLNDGKEPLEIDKRIGKSCGCTVPSLKKYKLKPGETCELSIQFTAGNIPGLSRKQVWVMTKPPALPERLTLTITANVREIVHSAPKHWNFEVKKGSANNTIPLVLKSGDGKAFRVLSYTCTGQVVKLQLDSKKSLTHTIPIKVDLDKLRQTPQGIVMVRIDHPKVKLVTVQFDSVMPFSAYPASKRFFYMEPGKTERASIKIVSNFGQKFSLGKLVPQNGYIKVLGTKKTEDGYQIDIGFTIPKNEAKRLFVSDYLTVNIKGHPKDALRIRCYGRVPRH